MPVPFSDGSPFKLMLEDVFGQFPDLNRQNDLKLINFHTS